MSAHSHGEGGGHAHNHAAGANARMLAIALALTGVFLVSEDGVQVSDKAKKHFKFIRFNTSVKRLRPEMIFDGNINAGTVARLPGNRLLVYRDDRVVFLDLVKRTSKSITIPGGVPAYNNSHKDLLCQDSKGLVYLVNQRRVFRVNEKDQLELIWQSGSAPQFNVTAFFVDRSDVLWISVNTHGITKIDLRAIPFYTRPYKSGFVADILEEAGIPPSQIPAEWTDSAIDYYFRQAWASDNQLYLTANLWGNGEIFSYDGATLSRFNRARHSKVYTALVVKPGEENPTGYLVEVADLLSDPNGRTGLNLRENSVALLEALAACAAVMEIDRAGLHKIRDVVAVSVEELAGLDSRRYRPMSVSRPRSIVLR